MQAEVLERSIPLEKTDPTRRASQVVTVLNSFIIDSFSAGWGEHSLAAYRKTLFSNPWFPATGRRNCIPSNSKNCSVLLQSIQLTSKQMGWRVGAGYLLVNIAKRIGNF